MGSWDFRLSLTARLCLSVPAPYRCRPDPFRETLWPALMVYHPAGEGDAIKWLGGVNQPDRLQAAYPPGGQIGVDAQIQQMIVVK